MHDPVPDDPVVVGAVQDATVVPDHAVARCPAVPPLNCDRNLAVDTRSRP